MIKRAPGYAARNANVLPQQRAAYREGKLIAVKASTPSLKLDREAMRAERERKRNFKSIYSNR